ncbi:MAG: hypothetical protein IPK01_08445 [Acidobacteria bacterium]|nr:hypothetical protein [Acidobacteriota bacterium]
MTSISIKLNGETKTISDTPTLDLLLEHFSLPKQRVAIGLNGTMSSAASIGLKRFGPRR